MGFKEKFATPSRSRVRTGSDYLQTTPDHPSVIRIMDEEPSVCWSHYIPKGHTTTGKPVNNGKGGSIICPGPSVCPVCQWNNEQTDDKKKLRSRRQFAVNVLDKTPVVKCEECGEEHYEVNDEYPTVCTNPECGADISELSPEPRNKVQIFMKGKSIADQIVDIESEFGPVTDRDLKLTTRGKGTETRMRCYPQKEEAIDYVDVLGEDWEEQKYDVENVVKPLEIEQIRRIFNGEDFFDVVKG